MSYSAVITGVGSYLPQKVMTNDDMAKIVDTSDEWIRGRTGIQQRHIAAEGEVTSDLAAAAAEEALNNAGVSKDEIDLIIVATTTPDLTMPSTAAIVQKKLGIAQGAAFDVAAVCSGFVYGMSIVKAMIASAQAKKALLIGAETMSRILDWEDRSTCVLFGDGAGAVVIEAQENTDRGIQVVQLRADGSQSDILNTTGGVSTDKQAGNLFMAGQEVFRHGVEKMAEISQEVMAEAGLSIDDVDWFIPHQANARIVQSIGRKLKIAPEKIILTLHEHANTSAASIPLAMSDAAGKGQIKEGQIVVTPALGAGLTWGCCIIKW